MYTTANTGSSAARKIDYPALHRNASPQERLVQKFSDRGIHAIRIKQISPQSNYANTSGVYRNPNSKATLLPSPRITPHYTANVSRPVANPIVNSNLARHNVNANVNANVNNVRPVMTPNDYVNKFNSHLVNSYDRVGYNPNSIRQNINNQTANSSQQASVNRNTPNNVSANNAQNRPVQNKAEHAYRSNAVNNASRQNNIRNVQNNQNRQNNATGNASASQQNSTINSRNNAQVMNQNHVQTSYATGYSNVRTNAGTSAGVGERNNVNSNKNIRNDSRTTNANSQNRMQQGVSRVQAKPQAHDNKKRETKESLILTKRDIIKKACKAEFDLIKKESSEFSQVKSPFPITAVVTIIICTIAVMFLVYSAVLVKDISDDIANLQNRTYQLMQDERDLQIELEVKNDLRAIEEMAVNNIGMINKESITKKYIHLGNEDKVELNDFSVSSQNQSETTLLSSLTGKK